MLRSLPLIATAAIVAAPGVAQSTSTLMAGPTPVTQTVLLQEYNPANGTYIAYVTVNATPCKDVSFNPAISIPGVKTPDEAKAKAAPAVAKIMADVKAAASRCGK